MSRLTHPYPARVAILLAVCLLILIAPAAVVLAQGATPTIQKASLMIWPEYDDPGLLVILSGDLDPGTSLPQTVAFPVPANARNIQAAYRDASGQLLTREWQMVDGKVTYEVPTTGFHLEYYVDRPPSGDARQIEFAFETPYPLGTLDVTVQQPARATDFSLEPAAENTLQRPDGLTYYLFDRINLAAGEKVPMTIGYTKTDSSLTAPQLAVTADQTDNALAAVPPPGMQTPSTDWRPYLLIGAGVALLIGALAYWYVTRRRTAAAPAQAAGGTQRVTRPTTSAVRPAGAPVRRAPQAGATTADRPTPVSAGTGAFCSQCGNPLRPDDRFCSQCGTQRK